MPLPRLFLSGTATKPLEEGHPDPEGGSFEEIHEYLQLIWDHWKEMRRVMRVELGVNNSPVSPPSN